VNIQGNALMEQHARYKATRERLWGGPAKKPIIQVMMPAPSIEFVEPIPPQEPEWKSADVYFDDHVLAWRSLISKLLIEYRLSAPMDKRSAKEIILEVIEMFPGVNLREVQGPSRNRKAVRARQVAMYEVATQRPDLSSPMIGSIFGDRDHTTVLHAIHKIRAMKEAGESLLIPNDHF
jgi:hypothetical protein